MSRQTYYYVVAGVFFVLATAHALRVINGWDASIAGYDVPLWLSWVAIGIAGYLAWRGYKYGKRM